MNLSSTVGKEIPAALQFVCASSLQNALLKMQAAHAQPFEKLRIIQNVLLVASEFQEWVLKNADLENLEATQFLELEKKFGDVCLRFLAANEQTLLTEKNCLRVALALSLPIRHDKQLPIPVDLQWTSQDSRGGFKGYRIQTVREDVESGDIVPFIHGDDPFDDQFGNRFFGFYGIGDDGLLEHIADRGSLAENLQLIKRIAPEIEF